MVSEELKNIIDQIDQQGKMNFNEPATEDQIKQFESEHGINLPLKYREWLMLNDGGDFFLPAGVQMYGVLHKPIIDVEDNDRPSSKYIVIGCLASGDPVLCERTGERISIYNHEEGRIEDDEIYEDFFAFLTDLYNILGIGE